MIIIQKSIEKRGYNFENYMTWKDVLEPPLCITSSLSFLLTPLRTVRLGERSYSKENAYHNTKAEDANIFFQLSSIAGAKPSISPGLRELYLSTLF